MINNYINPITNDGGLNGDVLYEQIIQNLFFDIGNIEGYTWIDNIKLGKQFQLFTSTELTLEQQDIIDQTISEHNGNNCCFMYYGHVLPKDVKEIDFDLSPFYKKRYIEDGVLNKTEYYLNFDQLTNTYSDLVLEKVRYYQRNSFSGLVELVTTHIHWFLDNGQLGSHKILKDYYDFKRGRQENKERRQNIISEMEEYMLGYLYTYYEGNQTAVLTNIKQVIDDISIDCDKYVNGNGDSLENAINSFTYPFVTQQFKDSCLDIIIYNWN